MTAQSVAKICAVAGLARPELAKARCLMVEETADHITIKDTAGVFNDIPLDQIDRKVMQKNSLMPEGLSGTMSLQELVDLVTYLSTLQG